MSSESFSCRLKNVFYMKRKLFSSAVYLNISIVSEEILIDTFPEVILFYSNEKCLLVELSKIDPCHFTVVGLKGKGLKVTSAKNCSLA